VLKRLRTALLESYVGAIALGYVLAQAVLHFANIFTSPFTEWLVRREYPRMSELGARPGLSLRPALPELVRAVALIVLLYFLLRWLYFKTAEEAPDPESHAAS
jgi:hypothetical protein